LSAIARAAVLTVVAAGLPALSVARTPHAQAAASCPAGGCLVTIDARDFVTKNPLPHFSYIVNVDNTKLPSDPTAISTESNSPIVREGNEVRNSFHLAAGRYLISVRGVDHKMWGAYVNLPADAAADGSVVERIELTEQSDAHPLPLGKIRAFVFEDNAWTNGAPDTEEAGLQGFQVGLEEQTHSAVTVDYNNNPLCGGICLTDSTGFAQIDNLGPATYFIDVHPPDGPCNSDPNSQWYQTTTIDGGLQLLASVEEGADGTGAPGEQLWEPPNNRTAYWFGFVCSPQPFATPGTGEITGQARNWVEWAPYTTGTFTDVVPNAFVALSDSTTDRTVYAGQADGNGNFDIQNVPAGSYNLAIWDEQLSYIMRFKPIDVASGQTLDVNETGDDGSVGVGVSRWFGWLDGDVYKDLNNNGKFDAGIDTPIANTDMDQRWRDGSIKETTTTDAHGHYEYPTAEGGALGRWIVNEQGFARFSSYPGPSAHDEHTGAVTPSCAVDPPAAPANPCLPTNQGGGLLTNQLMLEGHRATVDWGKRDYPAGTPGQIVGITYFATTRNEFDAKKQAHEDYEPGIPDVTVYLEGPGPDGQPNTGDDVVLNKYVTDHWQQPSASQDPQADGNTFKQSCNPIKDLNGADITNQFNPNIGPNCLEVPLTGEQTKDGAFDGGYAFADYCPNGYDLSPGNTDGTCNGGSDPVPLVAGTYITHAVMPSDGSDVRACNTDAADPNVSVAKGAVPGGGNGCLYRPVKEEDVNVDLGNHFTPAIPDPPCTGDDHVIDQSTLVTRSNYFGVAGAHAPLCDKKLVVLNNGQNANADFHMMTNFITDPNGSNPADTRIGDVAEPGRLVGQVFNDIYFETDPESPWYGEPRPIAGIPIGIYARVDTVPNVNQPFDPNVWRLLMTTTTSPDGSFEALVPSTETLNCPIPQGPCPGMYLVSVDDPGSKAHPNANYNPNLLAATTPAEAWPGLTTQLDLPLDPISGTACEDPAVPARPELLQVSRPYVNQADAGTGRRVTIQGDFIGTAGPTGATGGHVTLTDPNGTVTTLTRANGGVVSWTPGTGATPDTVVIQVPAVNTTTFRPGPKQLQLITATANGGVSTVNGITMHVLGANGTGTGAVRYTPQVVNVAPPPPAAGSNAHALQNAIDAAVQNGSGEWPLLVLKAGTYNENVVQWKPVKIQGLGPGGIIGGHELQARDPEDPRFHIVGSVIDGRFFQQNATAYDAGIAAHAPYAGVDGTHPVLRGADLTVVAKSTSAYPSGIGASRIDGLGLKTGSGEGAGGIQVQAHANNLQITNDVLENNGGVVAGGIGLGQPYDHASHNYNVRVANDRLIGNGGLTQAGGIGVFYGSNNYEVAGSVVCSNFSVNYGAGVSHIGLSPGGNIHDNQIYYNESVDSGAGVAIESELPVGGGIGDGTGTVNLDSNLIQSNYSGDDGGGVFVLDALTAAINLRNNMIVDNGSADIGGAAMLDDSSNVRFVNNTVANNVSTASSENSDGNPHSAGLASEANDPLFQAMIGTGASVPRFSKPAALFNNVFWDNQAFTLSQPGPGATLVAQGFIDFEVHGTCAVHATCASDTFTPRYSDITANAALGADGVTRPLPGGQGNLFGAAPAFVAPFILELTVSGSRLDPQTAAVTITGADPPVGLTGNYHITAASALIDRGVRCSNATVPAALPALLPCTGGGIQAPIAQPSATNRGGGDIDGQFRPMARTTRIYTLWDLGADELIGIPVPLP
jgi:large repetitive protein